MMALLRNLRALIQRRSLIGSDMVIVLVTAMHVSEAVLFLTTPKANGSIGMASLLAVFRDPNIAAWLMLEACALAAVGQWLRGLTPMQRLLCLVWQLSLLVITAGGALYAVAHGSYADGVLRPWQFLYTDQYPRMILAPLAYWAAIRARMKAK